MVEAIDLGLFVPQAAEEGELELLQGFLHLCRAVFPDQQALAFMVVVVVVPHVPLFVRGRPIFFEPACRRLAHPLIAEQLLNALENLFHLAVSNVLAPPCGYGVKL